MVLQKKQLLGWSIIAVFFVGGLLIWDTFFTATHIRFKGTSIFGTSEALTMFKHKEEEMFYDATLKINLTRRLFHDNTLFTSADLIVKGYVTHFAPTFLFFDYDQKQHHTPFIGLCYIWMLPFIPLGFYYLVRTLRKREAFLIIAWFLISPIPASVTWDIPHAIRTFGMVIPLVTVTAFGVYYSFALLVHKKLFSYVGGVLFVCFVFLSSYYYVHQYMIHLPSERSKDWVYGRKEMTAYIETHKHKYNKIIVSSSLEWPYIFMLYYSKYDPMKYLAQGGTVSGGFAEEGNRYDIFEFHRFRAEDIHSAKTLFVGRPQEFMSTIKPVYIINYLDGTPAIYIAEGDINI